MGWGGAIASNCTCTHTSCNHSEGVWCVKKRVGCRGTVSVHTGGIDNWWKLMKDSVPNSVPTTKGSMKVNKKKSFAIFDLSNGDGKPNVTC